MLERHHYPVTVAVGSDPWCKAAAVMPAVRDCPDGIVIIADADVWTDGLPEAVRAVSEGASWARPFSWIHRLTREGTAAVLRGEDWREQSLEECHRGVLGGGVVVARRETLLRFPMDPRFLGWGQEDEALGAALRTLAGRPWRGGEALVHLWHPPQERLDRRKGSARSWELYVRYMEARRDPRKMRALLKEIDDHRPDETRVQDPAALAHG